MINTKDEIRFQTSRLLISYLCFDFHYTVELSIRDGSLGKRSVDRRYGKVDPSPSLTRVTYVIGDLGVRNIFPTNKDVEIETNH